MLNEIKIREHIDIFCRSPSRVEFAREMKDENIIEALSRYDALSEMRIETIIDATPELILNLEEIYTKPPCNLTGFLIMLQYGNLWRKGLVERPPIGSDENSPSLVLTKKGFDVMFDN